MSRPPARGKWFIKISCVFVAFSPAVQLKSHEPSLSIKSSRVSTVRFESSHRRMMHDISDTNLAQAKTAAPLRHSRRLLLGLFVGIQGVYWHTTMCDV
uniref:Putative secreted protein n=1 Tax=Anopheles darlingi TaxID=43151 RepID=A0A2M4D4U2_ANODA